jgi:hypothetical protein
MTAPAVDPRADLLAAAEAQAADDAVMRWLMRELEEAVAVAERKVALAPLCRRLSAHRPRQSRLLRKELGK